MSDSIPAQGAPIEPGMVLPKSNLFAVFAADGSKSFIWAASEEDLASSMEGIAFAASLAEIEALAEQLRAEMARAMDLTPEELAILEGRSAL